MSRWTHGQFKFPVARFVACRPRVLPIALSLAASSNWTPWTTAPTRRTARPIYAEEAAAVAVLKAILYSLRSRNDHSVPLFSVKVPAPRSNWNIPFAKFAPSAIKIRAWSNDLASSALLLSSLSLVNNDVITAWILYQG